MPPLRHGRLSTPGPGSSRRELPRWSREAGRPEAPSHQARQGQSRTAAGRSHTAAGRSRMPEEPTRRQGVRGPPARLGTQRWPSSRKEAGRLATQPPMTPRPRPRGPPAASPPPSRGPRGWLPQRSALRTESETEHAPAVADEHRAMGGEALRAAEIARPHPADAAASAALWARQRTEVRRAPRQASASCAGVRALGARHGHGSPL